MLKKTILILSIGHSLLFGDYYTSTDSRLREDKILKFQDNIAIHFKRNGIIIKSRHNLGYLQDKNSQRQYRSIIIKEDISSKLNPFAKKEIISKLYNVYSFNDIIKQSIREAKFLIKTPSGTKMVEMTEDTDFINAFINYKYEVRVYKYTIKKAWGINGKSVDIKEKNVLTTYITNNGSLVGIDLLDSGLKSIIKVEDSKLIKFKQEKALRIIEVKKFNFKQNKLYLSYVSNASSSVQRLKISYEMKKKNIKTILESPVSLFDPENKSSQVEKNVGILRNYKNKELYEIKKVQLIDGTSDVSWLNHPKKRFVTVNYINDGVKDKDVLSKSKKQQFYGIEGVFYLASWMDKNNIRKKVFTYMNGSIPFDATMRQSKPHHFDMQKSGKTIFSFIINSKGFVSQFSYPNYDLTLVLESAENDLTRKNKQLLKKTMSEYGIKLIKE